MPSKVDKKVESVKVENNELDIAELKSGSWVVVTELELSQIQDAEPSRLKGYKPFLDGKNKQAFVIKNGKACIGKALIS